MRKFFQILALCCVCSAGLAGPPKPERIEEVTWLKIQLSAAKLTNLKQQKALAENAAQQAAKELAQVEKDHDALVAKIKTDYKLTERDQVDDKGVITRAVVPAAENKTAKK